jgi:methionyl-tRNA synthetase
MSKQKILVTAALPYINNVPHMGHIVGSHLPADIFYRYCRAKGHDTLFIGGSDEHGTPSAVAAKELGMHPQQLVDRLHEIHRQVYKKLRIDYSNYSRTSNQPHHQTVRDFFKVINEKGYVSKGSMKMYFCENDNMFLPDRFVVGTCSKCDYDSANADQCESCASVLTPDELIDPHCKSCDATPVMKESEHLYIRLDKLSDCLDKWIESNKGTWRNHVYGEAKKWITEGLRERSITRDLEWGVKVPSEVLDNKVFYVWFDAPIGYMTFTRELGEDVFDEYWRDPESKIYHFLGKDNIPFHTVFWPGMILAHEDFNLPSNVVGYNYLTFEGQKFSKSKGVGVFCYNLLDSDIDVDVLRSYLTTVIPETGEAAFKWEGFRSITNNELIAKLGNFFNRTLNMVWKNFDGQLDYGALSGLDDVDNHLIEAIKTQPSSIGDLFFGVEFREAYRKIMQYASEGNVYLHKTAPWNLIKEGREEEAKKSLYLALNLCKSLAIVSSPILPESMQRLWTEQLNLPGSLSTPRIWDEATKINIPHNHRTNKPKPLYARIDDRRLEELQAHLSKPHSLEELVR